MDKQLQYVLARFASYYSKARFSIPQIEKREFGMGIEKKIDTRHMGFSSEDEFRNFLAGNTPLYVSHSVAYYSLPKATPMERKSWLGADLVFDLDLETGSKYLTSKDMGAVRSDALRLIEEFLIPDFGISQSRISVNFSGNRGFHIHVRDERFAQLKGDERREIISYIKGEGLKFDAIFAKEDVVIDTGKRRIMQERLIGPNSSSFGYGGRFARRVLSLLDSEPKRLGRDFAEGKARDLASAVSQGNWNTIPSAKVQKMWASLEGEISMASVNIDAGVTQDASKLIRVPDSIHGSTGLAAKTVPLTQLQKMEPMHDALAFGLAPLKITATEDIPEIEMGSTTHEKIQKGQQIELPEYFALYLKLKGSAELALE